MSSRILKNGGGSQEGKWEQRDISRTDLPLVALKWRKGTMRHGGPQKAGKYKEMDSILEPL